MPLTTTVQSARRILLLLVALAVVAYLVVLTGVAGSAPSFLGSTGSHHVVAGNAWARPMDDGQV